MARSSGPAQPTDPRLRWGVGLQAECGLWRVLALLLLGAVAGSARASEQDPQYGEMEILEEYYRDSELRSGHIPLGRVDDGLERYFDMKERLREKTGLQYVLESAPILQGQLNGGAGPTANLETNAIARWSPIDFENPKRGNLMVWYQFANTIGSDTTAEFLQEMGVLSPLNGGDTGDSLTRSVFQQIAWEQWFLDDRLRFMLGKQTTRVTMNLNRYAVGDREDFFSPMIVNNPVVPYTARIGLALFGEYQTDDWYVSGMVRDADGFATYVDWSVHADELEYIGEFGFTPDDLAGLGQGVYRLTLNYTNPVGSGAARQPSGWDASLSFDQNVGDDYGLFFRYAYASEYFRAFRQNVALGAQIKHPLGFRDDRIGVAAWWGDPSGRSRHDEYGLEAFWKLQVLRFLEVTPDLQLVIDPALSSDAVALVGGLRLRVLF